MTIADLKPGQKGTIRAVKADIDGVIRLMVLGLVEGAEIRHENSAIGGDPLEITVYGAAISVRRDQARHFSITGIESDD
jgi:Fe2+ transport system protein FeoA